MISKHCFFITAGLLLFAVAACAAPGSITVIRPDPATINVSTAGNGVTTLVVPGPQGPAGPMLTQDVNEFAMTPTGFVTNNAQLHTYIKQGQSVTLQLTPFTGTSNSTSLTVGTLPVGLRPYNPVNALAVVYDNGVTYLGRIYVNSTGVISFYKDFNAGAFNSSGSKGLASIFPITYITN